MQNRRSEICGALALAISIAAPAFSQDSLTLWYQHPAKLWVEALPLGNGFLGGMIFGGVAHERIQFNEHTVWTGEPHDYAHAGASKFLPQIQQLLFEGKQKEAEDLATREFMSVPLHQKAYQQHRRWHRGARPRAQDPGRQRCLSGARPQLTPAGTGLQLQSTRGRRVYRFGLPDALLPELGRAAGAHLRAPHGSRRRRLGRSSRFAHPRRPWQADPGGGRVARSEQHTSELQP